MNKSSLGIMTVQINANPPFPEAQFFGCISEAARSEGIPVMVFHPHKVDFKTMTVTGYQLQPSGQWVPVAASVPSLIYDRCFYLGSSYNRKYKPAVTKLQENKSIRFLGVGLKGKWQLYQIASQHPELSVFIPPTKMVDSIELRSWLNQYPSIILKPANGSLGIGVIKAAKISGNGIKVEGRGLNNVPFSSRFQTFTQFTRFFKNHIMRWKYLVQPYLSLTTKQGTPFDVRLLVQKNGSGRWVTTGKAVRIGQKGSITSNLHGGGKAMGFDHFLRQNYTSSQIQAISSQIATLENRVPDILEKNHGPLVELGIDIGIDTDCKVWLIEANSKPGRQIFIQLGDQEAILNSQLNPFYYAKYLMQSQ